MKNFEVIAKLSVFALLILFTGCGGSSNNSTTDNSSQKALIGGSVQGKPLSLTGSVSTFAGTAGTVGSSDGTGADARFNQPSSITTDSKNLYVTDGANHTIRKTVIATGVVTTLAGTAGNLVSADGIGNAASFNYPGGITTDGTNLFVAEFYNNSIRKIELATGVVTTLTTVLPSGAAAYFYHPGAITIVDNNLYIAEQDNHTISKLELATGIVTTIAGKALTSGAVDGVGTAALFYNPSGITTDGKNLYVTDFNNHTIRKIVIATGAVTTIAGVAGSFGSVDGVGTAALFRYPHSITSDGTNLYVTDGNRTIRKIEISSSTVTTIAGIAGIGSYIDGTRTDARFSLPNGIIADGTSLYVTELTKNTIRKVQ